MPRPDKATDQLDHAHQVGTISSRALLGIRRLAVTISDLAGRDAVTSADMAEAYRLRTGRNLPSSGHPRGATGNRKPHWYAGDPRLHAAAPLLTAAG